MRTAGTLSFAKRIRRGGDLRPPSRLDDQRRAEIHDDFLHRLAIRGRTLRGRFSWGWGINGALLVVGATLAIFITMDWGFAVTLVAASGTYLVGLIALLSAI